MYFRAPGEVLSLGVEASATLASRDWRFRPVFSTPLVFLEILAVRGQPLRGAEPTSPVSGTVTLFSWLHDVVKFST